MATLRGCSNPPKSLLYNPSDAEETAERIGLAMPHRVLYKRVTFMLMQMLSSRSSMRWRRRLLWEMAMFQSLHLLRMQMPKLRRMRVRILLCRLLAMTCVLPPDPAAMSRKRVSRAG